MPDKQSENRWIGDVVLERGHPASRWVTGPHEAKRVTLGVDAIPFPR